MKYMKHTEPSRSKKQTKLIIILASVLLFFVIAVIAAKLIVDNLEEDAPPYTEPQLMDGEALLNRYYTLAYPQIEAAKMTYIEIETPDGKYGLIREDDGSLYILHTPEGRDELSVYYPPIADTADNFNYSSLFAKAEGDSYGITNVYYMCSVLGTMYFDERIKLPTDDDAERSELLRYYGFTENNGKRIKFLYKNGDGEEELHELIVGDKMITGSGYYYMVDDRPYIYVTTSAYLDYAFGGAASLINSMLVSEGLAVDSYFEPYLTPEYKQWQTTLHKNAGDVVEAGSKVIVTAEILSPQNPATTDNPEDFIAGGYLGAGFGKTEFDLTEYTDERYSVLLNALVGAAVGSYEGNEIIFTVIGSNLAANIPDGETSVSYEYKVTHIEAILDGGELSTIGTPVGQNKLLKITYTAKVGGVSVTPVAYHAVINLDSTLIPGEAKAAFAAASVGELSSPIEFSVTYSKDDQSNQTVSKLIITEIHKIINSEGIEVDTVEDGCIVTYSYVIKVGTEESKTYQGYIDLSDSENSTAEKLSELLVGQSVGGDLSIVVDTYIEYPQVMADFDTVKIKEINGFVTSKLVVAFRFVNEELRDPFYGDSIYENQLEGNNKNYGLSDNVCQTVLSILGGLGESSTSSNGFIGVETVAVGLNPDTMEKYGLYAENAYKIRFVLPRGVEDLVDENEQEFFTWASELGFNLYISEEQDGYRYVASDMYDIVAKVKASDLVFLNYGFVDFWARRTPMLLDVKNIASMKLDFNMSNVYGSYNFEMKHTDYYYDMNGKPQTNYQEGFTKDVFIELFVTEGEGSMHTALTDYIRETGEARVDFSKFYGGGEDEWIDYDTSDVSYFKDVMMILFLTNYVDMVSDEERASAMEHEPLMTMELSLKGKADKYIYEFRRFNERQIMVTIKCCAPDGAVRYESSDFYISSAVTREIVSGFVYLLNGKEIDPDIFYEELPLAE